MSYAALSSCCKLQPFAAVVFPTLPAHLIYRGFGFRTETLCVRVCTCTLHMADTHMHRHTIANKVPGHMLPR